MIYTTQKNERLSNTNATKNWDELGCSEGQTVPTPKVTLVMLLLLQIMNEEREIDYDKFSISVMVATARLSKGIWYGR